jgi:hypothetical protein
MKYFLKIDVPECCPKCKAKVYKTIGDITLDKILGAYYTGWQIHFHKAKWWELWKLDWYTTECMDCAIRDNLESYDHLYANRGMEYRGSTITIPFSMR